MNAQASVNSSLGRLPCTFPAGRCVNVCMFVCTYMCMHVCKRVGWRLRRQERRFGPCMGHVVELHSVVGSNNNNNNVFGGWCGCCEGCDWVECCCDCWCVDVNNNVKRKAHGHCRRSLQELLGRWWRLHHHHQPQQQH